MSTLTDKKLALIIGGAVILALVIGYFAYQQLAPSDSPSESAPKFIKAPEPEEPKQPQADQIPAISDEQQEPTNDKSFYQPEYTEAEISVERETRFASNTDVENSSTRNVDSVRPAAPAITARPPKVTGAKSITFEISGYSFFLVRCSLNNPYFRRAESCSSTRTFNNLPEGTHTFRAWQSDRDGNVSWPSSYTFTIKRTTPKAPKITHGPSGMVFLNYVKFRFGKNSSARFRCSINNRDFDYAERCKRHKGYYRIPDGNYQFRLWKIDRYGNRSKPTVRNFTINATLPDPPRVLAPGYSTVVDNPVFVNLSGESGATFYCSIDNSAFSQASVCPAASLVSLSPGTYILYAWQVDEYGRRSEPRIVPFTVLGSESTALMRSTAEAPSNYSADTDGSVVDNQTTDANSDLTLDVLAALELSVPSDDQAAIAPESAGSSAEIAFSSGADIRSNLSWEVVPAIGIDGYLSGGSTGPRSLLNALVFDTASSVDSGSRNASNAAQSYQSDFDQTVSWGDEAGPYLVVLTHQAAQTLP
jgi:hypothetical protein